MGTKGGEADLSWPVSTDGSVQKESAHLCHHAKAFARSPLQRVGRAFLPDTANNAKEPRRQEVRRQMVFYSPRSSDLPFSFCQQRPGNAQWRRLSARPPAVCSKFILRDHVYNGPSSGASNALKIKAKCSSSHLFSPCSPSSHSARKRCPPSLP